MTSVASKFWYAILLSLLLNAPFAIGELLTSDVAGLRSSFPLAIFIGLWLEVFLFVYLLMSVIQTFKSGEVRQGRILVAVQVLVLGMLAWAWATLVIDQWPCFFLGGSGC